MPNVVVGGGSHDYDKVISFNIEHGRYFTPSESRGRPVAVIVGHDIAMQLFGRHDAVGETMKVEGHPHRNHRGACPRRGKHRLHWA